MAYHIIYKTTSMYDRFIPELYQYLVYPIPVQMIFFTL